MTEFSLAVLEDSEVTSWDFAGIKAQLAQILDEYKNIVYTDDSIKSAKDDKSLMTKAKKIIDDKRKAFKKQCLAPYETVEPQLKELTDMIEAQRKQIDETVKDYEERQRESKKGEIKSYYDKKANDLGKYAEAIFPRIFQDSWANKTTQKSKYQEELLQAIGKVREDLSRLKNLDSPFIDTVIEKYIQTLSYDDAVAKNEELLAASRQAGLMVNTGVTGQLPVAEAVAEKKPVPSADGTVLRVYANQYQLTQITDFLKAIGVTYEVG